MVLIAKLSPSHLITSLHVGQGGVGGQSGWVGGVCVCACVCFFFACVTHSLMEDVVSAATFEASSRPDQNSACNYTDLKVGAAPRRDDVGFEPTGLSPTVYNQVAPDTRRSQRRERRSHSKLTATSDTYSQSGPSTFTSSSSLWCLLLLLHASQARLSPLYNYEE